MVVYLLLNVINLMIDLVLLYSCCSVGETLGSLPRPGDLSLLSTFISLCTVYHTLLPPLFLVSILCRRGYKDFVRLWPYFGQAAVCNVFQLHCITFVTLYGVSVNKS